MACSTTPPAENFIFSVFTGIIISTCDCFLTRTKFALFFVVGFCLAGSNFVSLQVVLAMLMLARGAAVAEVVAMVPTVVVGEVKRYVVATSLSVVVLVGVVELVAVVLNAVEVADVMVLIEVVVIVVFVE